jgi:hypothetical protein
MTTGLLLNASSKAASPSARRAILTPPGFVSEKNGSPDFSIGRFSDVDLVSVMRKAT